MKCPKCSEQMIGVEYGYPHPQRYDGISEWLCETDSIRVGRWTGKILVEGEFEPRLGGKP